jgi:hypothetical protein
MLSLPVTSSKLYDRETILLNIIKHCEKKCSSLKVSKSCRDAVSYTEKKEDWRSSSYSVKEINKTR